MKSVIRSFPMSVGTFLIGYYVGSPGFTQDAPTVKYTVAAGLIIAVVIATAILCAITRSTKQQQSGGFARTRTGRS